MSLYQNHTDEQLLDLLADSNEMAFTEIYHRYADLLFEFAWNVLKDDAEGKDAVQEVFVWLWNNRKKVRVTVLKYYLLAAVKYKLIRVIQRSKRKNEILAARPIRIPSQVEETVEVRELEAIIFAFSQSLPPRAKQIFHLSRNEFRSNKEIAAMLHISEKTVENQMTITLKKLKHTLGHLSFWIALF